MSHAELTLDDYSNINDISFTAVVGDQVYGGNAYDISFSGDMKVVIISASHVDEHGPVSLTQELDPNTDAIEIAVRHLITTAILAQSSITVGLSPGM